MERRRLTSLIYRRRRAGDLHRRILRSADGGLVNVTSRNLETYGPTALRIAGPYDLERFLKPPHEREIRLSGLKASLYHVSYNM